MQPSAPSTGLVDPLQATDNPVGSQYGRPAAQTTADVESGPVGSSPHGSFVGAPEGDVPPSAEQYTPMPGLDPVHAAPNSGSDTVEAVPESPGFIERLWLQSGASAAWQAATTWVHTRASQLWARRETRAACVVVGLLAALLLFFFHFLADIRRLTALLGMAIFLAFCAVELTLPSKSAGIGASVRVRAGISWPRAVSSLSLQLLFGVLIVYTPMFSVFAFLGEQVNHMLAYSQAGANFAWTGDSALGPFVNIPQGRYSSVNVSSWAMDGHGNPVKQGDVTVLSATKAESQDSMAPLVGGFALNVLPSIIFFSALVEFANHIGVLPVCMRFFAVIFCSFTRCSAPEAIASAANVFVGMTNAPLLIKPFVRSSANRLGHATRLARGVMAVAVALTVS